MSALHQSQVRQYHEDGYIIPPAGLPATTLVDMQDNLSRFLESYDGSADFVPDVLRHDASWLPYASCPEIIEPLQQIMGDEIILWSSALFCKAAVGGKSTPWHQDGEYWPIRPLETVTAWIALDDVDTENGCLRVIPGSHKSRELLSHHKDTSGEGVLNLALKEELWHTADPVDLELKAGQFSLHDVYMVHGAEPNRSPRRRAGLVFRYMPASSTFDRQLAQQMIDAGKVSEAMRDRELYRVSG
jgi:ectoine hydroxylase-related dioxygenase (phytanoyl-CoA dioxygenase family)